MTRGVLRKLTTTTTTTSTSAVWREARNTRWWWWPSVGTAARRTKRRRKSSSSLQGPRKVLHQAVLRCTSPCNVGICQMHLLVGQCIHRPDTRWWNTSRDLQWYTKSDVWCNNVRLSSAVITVSVATVEPTTAVAGLYDVTTICLTSYQFTAIRVHRDCCYEFTVTAVTSSPWLLSRVHRDCCYEFTVTAVTSSPWLLLRVHRDCCYEFTVTAVLA